MSQKALERIAKEKEEKTGKLDLSFCELSEAPGELFELTGLQSLDLSVNKIADISVLEKLTGLQSLDLRGNQIADISFLEKLTGLQSLYLSGNQIADISFLEKLTGLQSLDLSGNQIADYSFLKKLTGLRSLFVRGNKIADISFLERLTGLRSLDLGYNQIADISFLEKLTGLQSLYLGYNQIADISSLEKLTSLQSLNLGGNKNADISFLEKLTGLKSLVLSYNQIADIRSLEKLIGLQGLDLSANQITDISFLESLTGLRSLDLSGNKIVDISFLERLAGLQYLYIRGNQIADISFLEKLNGLKTLYLSGNQISDISAILPLVKKGIPISWVRTFRDSGIILEGNPLSTPPPEIIKEGNEAVIAYFEELERQGSVPIYEAKLLIIGEGGSGKTSLARRLIDEKAPMPEEEESTKGIDILYHNFKTKENNDFRINIWDFGGQEIYHSTHQFFLTKRSLYILLDDTRKDDKTVNDATFNYWLQVVELLSENSPVLIVQNEKADRSKELDLKSMQARFENVKGSWATNLQNCRGLPEVKNEIEHQIQKLPLVGEMLPKQWAEIRLQLEKLAEKRDYINLEEYFEICANNQIPEEERALRLSSYLHDLGTFLHFQQNMVLADLFILRNTWATDAVYKVLDDEAIRSNYGYFTEDDLHGIWDDPQYRTKRPQLLALMERFQICYQLPDKAEKTWLAPQLLPVEAPDFDWETDGNLILRYVYEFMPKGLLSRFVVRMNRYVSNLDKAWRSGIFLHREKTDAFVRETYGSREIVVRVRGAYTRELMTLISEEIDAVNETYGEKLRATKLIPCICDTCQQSDGPYFHEFDDLKRRQEKHQPTAECKISYANVPVHGLLEGIFALVPRTDKESASTPGAEPKTVELFLASSKELKKDRSEVEIWIRRENDRLEKKGIYLKLNLWEDSLASMNPHRKQDDYNQAILRSDIFISLFATKVGKYSEEEFLVAFENLLKNGKTKYVYTYFKDPTVRISEIKPEDFESLTRFKARLEELGHFPSNYNDTSDLILQLKVQLDKIFDDMRFS